MNRNFALAFVIAAAAASASAGEITADPTSFTSTASRAEVQAELAAYQRSGVDVWSDHYNPLVEFRGSRTRAEVQAELKADRQEVAATGGELGASAQFAGSEPVVIERVAGEPRNAQ